MAVTAAGQTRIPARMPYPPVRHPTDHTLGWKHGRVLEALQIVVISAGAGVLEFSNAAVHAIERDTAFLVLPHLWHRYYPLPPTPSDSARRPPDSMRR